MFFNENIGYLLLIAVEVLSSAQITTGSIAEPPDEKWQDEITTWNGSISFQMTYAMNQARLTVKSEVPYPVDYWWQHGECYNCDLLKQVSLAPFGNYSYLVQSAYVNHLAVKNSSGAEICRDQKLLLERGEYWLIVSDTEGTQCDLVLFNDPPNIYLPILWAFLVLLGLVLIWAFIKCLYRKGLFDRCRSGVQSHDLEPVSSSKLELTENGSLPSVSEITTMSAGGTEKPRPRQRLRSLDTFRGMSLVVMIFVNYNGGGYYFFQHAIWNGLYIADLVFPWFIWIMGTSMVFSFKGMRKRNTPNKVILWRIVKRTVLLFVIGIFLTSSGVDLDYIRIPGVLQRFAITYFIVAMTHFMLGNVDLEYKKVWWSPVRDVVLYWGEWLVMLAVLALHLALTFALAEPGCPRGYLGPGGLDDGGQYFNCSGGAAGYIDRQFFTEDHLYRWNAIKTIHKSPQNHDPEGILGSLTSIFMCFLGLQAGKIIAAYENHSSRIVRWLTWGVVIGGIGTLLCEARLNGGWIPINKNLWSVSFVLILSGMAFVLLTAMYAVIDIWTLWSGSPLYYPGMNSIVIYMCHSIFASYFPVSWIMSDLSLHWQNLFLALWGTGIWILLAFILYKKKIFVAL